ncbi:Hexose transporter [Pleurostoma richardsiae]|uniref:Hexose transporter n=1 Tax=Pleurostoma richardsiae TaxID=41990 RepID=A0AA38SDQ6_9PEZI|nr:Hexose transporter [Pleurostoma richardsiae]
MATSTEDEGSNPKSAAVAAYSLGTPPPTVEEVLRDLPHQPLYKNKGLLKVYAVLVPGVMLFSSAGGYGGSMLNGLQALSTFKDFFHPSSAITGFINSCFWIGGIVSFPFAQIVADQLGRRNGVFFGASLILLAAILQGAAHNLAMFVIARIFLGFGYICSGTSAVVLVSELTHPLHRRVITGLYGGVYYIGAITAAWIVYGTSSLSTNYGWRIPSYLMGFYPLVNLVFLSFVPESPRWLVAKGRVDQARIVIAKAHTNGDEQHPLVPSQVSEIIESIELEKEINKKNAWVEFYTKRSNRKRLFLICVIALSMNMSGISITAYYLTKVLDIVGVTKTKEQTLINGILQIVSLWLISAVTMLISFTSLTIASEVVLKDPSNKSAAVAVIFFVFLFTCGYDWALNALVHAYPVELLPYKIRTVGLALQNVISTLSGFFNVFVNPIALAAITWKYYIVYIVYLSFWLLVVYFVFPETAGHALEEVTAKVADDDENFLAQRNVQ